MNRKPSLIASLAHVKRFAIFGVSFLVAFQIAGQSANLERISQKDLKPTKDGMPGELEWNKEVAISRSAKLQARIEVTSKGNGTLTIGNLKLKVMDSHDDGLFYEGGMLNIDFTDLDNDKKSEIIISGIVCFTDEKGQQVLRREAVVFIYLFQHNNTFKEIYRNTTIRLDMN